MIRALELFLNRLISIRNVNVTKAIVATMIIGLTSVADSQSFSPSPQQIEQFENLPCVQQEQLAKEMGFDISMLQGGASSPNSASVNNNEVVERAVNESEITQELSRQSNV